jgi:hypothetical protein
MNYRLIGVLTTEKLKEYGFIETFDESDESVPSWWELNSDGFCLMVDKSLNFSLMRLKPVTDPLNLKIESLLEVEMLLDWID